MKQRGSSLSRTEPVFWGRILYDLGEIDDETAQSRIVDHVHAWIVHDERKQWDKLLRSAERVIEDKKVHITHLVNETPISIIKCRDILEKKFRFTHEGAQYIFNSSVPDEVKPTAEGMIRLEIIFVVSKHYIITEGKRKFICMETVM